LEISWFDKMAMAISPSWGKGRIANKAKTSAFLYNSGYVTPASNRKSMKGTVVNPLSPDGDTVDKQPHSRALSRDLAMTSPLAISTLRRKTINVIGPELKLQCRIDRDFLGITDEQADTFETTFEREFDAWADSYACDYHGDQLFGELQTLIYFNTLLNGDTFFMLPWRKTNESPYELSIKLIDSDLVRNPIEKALDQNIKGGVEKNKQGQIVAYHVANYYESDYLTLPEDRKFKRVPVFGPDGRRQIWQIKNSDRIGQRRGMPIFAPVIDALKQLTRITDAEMMHILVSSFFSVFVKDMSGFGAMLEQGFTPAESVTGGGGTGPGTPQDPKLAGDEYDLEMGYGNVHYLDDQKEITIADPKKTDESFTKLFEHIAMQVTAAANVPIEKVMMHFQTSYAAAKGADNESWKANFVDRARIEKKFCNIVSGEFLREGVIKGRLAAPGYWDDMITAKAWARASWVGPGQGQLNPKDEAQAAVIKVNSNLSTLEEEYMKDTGGRWDSAMNRRRRELDLLEKLEITNQPDTNELVGPDGQENEPPSDEEENAE
jgi:lambda family phage portal protein